MGNVGAPVRATDADRGDILTYSIPDTADNAFFDIDRATGQLMVAAGVLDAEDDVNTDDEYVVMVTATDSSGGSDDCHGDHHGHGRERGTDVRCSEQKGPLA